MAFYHSSAISPDGFCEMSKKLRPWSKACSGQHTSERESDGSTSTCMASPRLHVLWRASRSAHERHDTKPNEGRWLGVSIVVAPSRLGVMLRMVPKVPQAAQASPSSPMKNPCGKARRQLDLRRTSSPWVHRGRRSTPIQVGPHVDPETRLLHNASRTPACNGNVCMNCPLFSSGVFI